jgi:hypothetical protein
MLYNPTLYLFEVRCWNRDAPLDSEVYFLEWARDANEAELDVSLEHEGFDFYEARRDETTMPATLDELNLLGAAHCAARIEG